MTEHPILFTGELVIKIMTCAKCGTVTLEAKCPKCGSRERLKTQTRRIITPQPVVFDNAGYPDYANLTDPKKKWLVGDTIWVRERFRPYTCGYDSKIKVPIEYKADKFSTQSDIKWKPLIHMPRWAARIFLEITSLRVERVQEISENDAEAEGVNCDRTYLEDFENLWDSINAKRGYGWDKNPWVWVVEFKINS